MVSNPSKKSEGKKVKELEKVKEPKNVMRKLGILMVEGTGAKNAQCATPPKKKSGGRGRVNF